MDAWGNVKTSSDPVSSVSYVYNSMGKPVEIDCEGSKTLMEYDAVGNKTSMTDPDAGITTYEYAADGKLLKQTDARGIVTTNTYDELGRLTTSHVGDMEITRTYGTSGNDNLQLIKTTCGNNSESYTYDVFGRLTSKTRSVEGDELHQYTYSYNMDGSIASVVYPGGLAIGYVYDANGYLMAKKYNNVEFKSLAFYDGITTKYKLLNTFGSKAVTLSTDGHIKSVDINCRGHKNFFEYEYDSATDNLLSRTGVNSQKETFTYDGVDRLTSVSYNGQRNLIIKYANDGNILNKLDVGNYEYGQKPHAVMSVDNIRRIIPSATLSTEFNELGRIGRIDDGNSLTSVDFVYGPDMQRWKSTSYNNGVVEKTTFYDTDYDKVIDKNGNVTEFIYVDDNFVMLRKDNGTFLPYVVVKDNIGSIISIYAGDGTQVYSASYDAWGKQTVTMNKIGFIRGYCGHEMLNDYQIINMNGRLYDPVLGRFLSLDNYVQTPDFSQNYNRYSYCLNNPLKYTDPSGELFGIDDLVWFGAAMGAFMGAMEAKMSGKSVWKGALVGGLSSFASYGVGSLFGHGLGTFGHELLRAGAHGLTSGALNWLNGDNFFTGVASGFASSLVGSGAQALNFNTDGLLASTSLGGGLASLASGGKFMDGFQIGMSVGLYNHSGDKVITLKKKLPTVYCFAKDLRYRKTFGYMLLGVGSGASSGLYKMWNPDAISFSFGGNVQFGIWHLGGDVGIVFNSRQFRPYINYNAGYNLSSLKFDASANVDITFYNNNSKKLFDLSILEGDGYSAGVNLGPLSVGYGTGVDCVGVPSIEKYNSVGIGLGAGFGVYGNSTITNFLMH